MFVFLVQITLMTIMLMPFSRLMRMVTLFMMTALLLITSYRIIPIIKLHSILIREGVQFPEVCLKQIYLETGFLSSTIYNENNNILGMKEPVYRPTTAIGSNRGHARYDNPLDCIKDYVLWQKYWLPRKGKNVQTTEDYLDFLVRV